MSHQRNLVEILMRGHDEGVKRVRELARAARSIQENGFSPAAFEQIAHSIRWINTDVRRHMETEEHYIFPLVEPEASRLVDQLRFEHSPAPVLTVKPAAVDKPLLNQRDLEQQLHLRSQSSRG